MKKWISGALTVALMTASAAVFSAEEKIIRLATTTSTYNSGLLDKLLPEFEKTHNAKSSSDCGRDGQSITYGAGW